MTEIEVKTTLRALFALNQIDIRIQQLINNKSEIPRKIASLNSDLNTMKKELSTLEEVLKTTQEQKTANEDIISQKKAWLAEREPGINSLSTQREYQAALKEIAMSKKDLLEREKSAETLVAKVTELNSQLEELKARNSQKIEELSQQIADNQSALDALDDQIKIEGKGREDIAKQADAGILARYQRILSKGAPAITIAESGTCSECSTRLPPQLYNQVLGLREILLCPHCTRILITEDLTLPEAG